MLRIMQVIMKASLTCSSLSTGDTRESLYTSAYLLKVDNILACTF